MKLPKITALVPLIILLLFFLNSCSKSESASPSGGNGGSQYFFKATINGTVAQFDSIQGLISSGTYIAYGAVTDPATAYSLAIAFPASNTINVATAFDHGKGSGLGYDNVSNDQYATDDGAHTGTYTITKQDLVNHVIAGTFSGTVVDKSSKTLTITNGSFNLPYVATPSGTKEVKPSSPARITLNPLK